MSITSHYSGTIKVGENLFDIHKIEIEQEPVTDDMMDATRRVWESTREFIIVDGTLVQPITDTTRLIGNENA